ncbi:putative membrane protein [Waddlia chondrophila 2032/99]|uniref:Putative membrane protein n=2 Tax=Waddlia chondrophila TaxID=71667 RepID=D6YWB8_WADCW|nr:TMEM14 family protein [Waddlia chondrophila]ADI38429.1 putative membrane protein [Waddlia chondrophila WSU 86-1044]CCB91514.1 putative membrane protein [Waddlia chondrophila 2032/99]
MKFTGILVIIYSLLVLSGGLIGYLMADSLPSLISGVAFGAALFTCGMGILRANVTALLISVALSGVLAVFFAYRYWLSMKLMPAGMMAIISSLIFLLLITTRARR